MDKSDDQLTEQFLGRVLESTGFSSISKIALQKLSPIPSAKMRILAKRVHQTMNQSKYPIQCGAYRSYLGKGLLVQELSIL